MLLRLAHESDVIGQGGLREEVETAPRLDHLEAERGQVVVEDVAFLLVLADIDTLFLQARHQPLHQRRGIDKAEDPVAEDRPLNEQFDFLHFRIRRQVADPLAGKGEIFGMGSDD